MKRSSYLLSILLVGLFFIACDKNDEPTPKLNFSPASIEVKEEASATVKVSGGTTPYTVKESDKEIATATVTDSEVKITGVKEGKTTIEVTDKKGVKGAIAVTVLKK